ncbi:hypothetical protein GCM10027422_38290 [Hymenobacter arcticus]
MAQELGLGVLPWSPLKMGKLSGKYTRENGEKMQGVRGSIVGQLTDKEYEVIEALQKVAAEHQTDAAAIALAWVQHKPGISSTIIGARTLAHLEANLKALDVKLTPEQVAALDAVSKPILNFPADFNKNQSPSYAHAGATVNGVPSQDFFNVPTDNSKRW